MGYENTVKIKPFLILTIIIQKTSFLSLSKLHSLPDFIKSKTPERFIIIFHWKISNYLKNIFNIKYLDISVFRFCYFKFHVIIIVFALVFLCFVALPKKILKIKIKVLTDMMSGH